MSIENSFLLYRKDIDGLRAIAVLAVLLYHFFPNVLPSGFVGVDVFFVISGFLISRILIDGMDSGEFRFLDFYARRIRRIFPALVVVLLTTLLVGWFVLMPDEYAAAGKQIAGGAGFIANFVFWSESGYFDQAAASKPLLHLWSLGIEEQFYILYPLMIWLIWTLRVNRLASLLLMFITSVFYSMYLTVYDPTASFYSPASRAWELLAGALAAALLARRRLNNETSVIETVGIEKKTRSIYFFQTSSASDCCSLIGLGILMAGLLFVPKAQGFPGFGAMVPVVGTALLVVSGPNAFINRTLLSWRPVVLVGLISYPLYLWHWLVLVIPTVVVGEELSAMTKFTLIIGAFCLAIATYTLIELPLKKNKNPSRITAFLLFFTIGVGGAGYLAFKFDGFESREAKLVQEIYTGDVGHDKFHAILNEDYVPCTPKHIFDAALVWKGTTRCHQSKKDVPIEIALIGDSHAEHLFIGLSKRLDRNSVYYIRNAIPIVSNPQFKDIFSYVLTEDSIETVILSAYWFFRLREVPDSSTFEDEFAMTISELAAKKKRVWVLEDTPTFSFDPEVCKFKRKFRQAVRCNDESKWHAQRNNYYMPAMRRVSSNFNNVFVVPTFDIMCSDSICSMEKNEQLLYRDRSHLNVNGSNYVIESLLERGWLSDEPE